MANELGASCGESGAIWCLVRSLAMASGTPPIGGWGSCYLPVTGFCCVVGASGRGVAWSGHEGLLFGFSIRQYQEDPENKHYHDYGNNPITISLNEGHFQCR